MDWKQRCYNQDFHPLSFTSSLGTHVLLFSFLKTLFLLSSRETDLSTVFCQKHYAPRESAKLLCSARFLPSQPLPDAASKTHTSHSDLCGFKQITIVINLPSLLDSYREISHFKMTLFSFPCEIRV